MQAEIEGNFRASAYAMLNCFVNQQRTMGDALHMNPTDLTIYLIVVLAGVQRLARLAEIPVELRGYAPAPASFVVPISRRAVAAASGLPRETVRRIIADLIARGHLCDAGRGGVTVVRGNVEHEHVEGLPSVLAGQVLIMVNQLRRLGVLDFA